ncbi:MAG: ComEC/Rec2 family competence protein [Arachnia propionica]|uniref:ComEC/Rec2 family competence protein n=1 Tax=Arachnia propionica TaxID=1750 RepID=UPI0026FFA9C1|nr:ComEC/Rec2 family competence protein [Arachnia propionica]
MSEQDWRLVPPALAAWAGAWIGTSGWRPGGGVLVVLLAGVLLVGVIGRSRWWRVMVVVLVVTTTAAGVRDWGMRSGALIGLADEEALVTAQLRLQGDPYRPPGRGDGLTVHRALLLRAVADDRQFTSRLPVTVIGVRDLGEAMADLEPGSTVELQGRLRVEEPGSSTAVAIFVQRVERTLDPPGPMDQMITGVRSGLRAASSGLPADQAGLVPSLVLGDRSAVPTELQEQFQATSLTHLMAVSGANLTLLLGVLVAAARWAGVRGWGIRGIAAVGVVAFVFVCRAEPSVLRAAVMGLAVLPAIGIGSGNRSLRNLGLAVLVLTTIDPWLSRSWGFALSVSACAGIVLLGRKVSDPLSRWVPSWLADAVAIPLAAQVATLPLTAELSGRVSLSGVLANVLAGPFVGPATVLGLIAAVLCWWPDAASGAAMLAGITTQPILVVARAMAGLPNGSLPWPQGLGGILSSLLLVVLIAWVVPRLAGHAGMAMILAGALVVVNLLPRLPPGPWVIAFCDVGQGDATVLSAGAEGAVLVDTGPDARPVLACLAELGVRRIPLVVLTHYHQDHVGGAKEVLNRFRPEVVVVSPLPSPPDAASGVAAAARAVGAEVVVAEPGLSHRIGELSWTVVSAWHPIGVQATDATESVAENDSSVVSLIDVGGLRVLLPGDIELDGQAQALRAFERLGIDPRVEVYKLPHHGAAKQDQALLRATGASLAVVSAGKGNEYGHPAERTLRTVREAGMAVARTDEQGLILVAPAADGVRVTTTGR